MLRLDESPSDLRLLDAAAAVDDVEWRAATMPDGRGAAFELDDVAGRFEDLKP